MPYQVEFPRDVAASLHQRLASTGSWGQLRRQERQHSPLAKLNRPNLELVRPLPSLAVLRETLDVAYVASLMEEEGRPISFTLGYLSPKAAKSLKFSVLRFKKAMPLSAATLAKVALSAVPTRTALGLWRSSAGPEIWGLMHHGRRTFAIDLEHQPTYLSLRVLRPGTFTVHYDQTLALFFSRDHSNSFESKPDLVGTLRDGAGIEPPVAVDLCRLARRMLAHWHGGAILITDLPPRGVKMHPSFTVLRGQNSLLKDALEDHEQAISGRTPRSGRTPAQTAHWQLRVEREHDDALDFIAQLTAVDGAVVLRNDLGLLGYGATITTPSRGVPDKVILVDPRAPTKQVRTPVSKLGGNRHRSAVSFCAQQKSLGLALVASQDGDLSLVARRTDGQVHVIRPFELGVGI